MSWSYSAPAAPLFAYLVLAGLTRLAGRLWDLADRRAQLLAVGFGETGWILLHLRLYADVVWPLVPEAAIHLALTVASVLVARQVLPLPGAQMADGGG